MRKLVERAMTFWAELHRRKVFSVGAAYLVAAWGASLGVAELLPAFGAPPWTVRFLIIGAALGFPVTLVLAWAYELTGKGVVRDDGVARKPDAADRGMQLTQVVGAGALTVSWRDAAGEHVRTFERGFVIGRDPVCGLRLDDPLVSRQHARIRLDRGVWQIEDLGSRNGTVVDGALVDRMALPRKAEVRLYPAGPVLRFEQQPSGATTVRAALDGAVTRNSDDA